MRRFVSVFAIAACGAGLAAANAAATPAQGSGSIGHVVSTTGATLAPSTAAASQKLQLVLPLKAHDAALQKFAQEVSTPSSREYHDFRSIGWLSTHFGANSAERAEVVGYLREHGATDVHVDATGMFVDAQMKASTAAQVFRTDLVSHGGSVTTPQQTPVIPASLQDAVSGVVGLNTTPLPVNANVSQAPTGGSSKLSSALSTSAGSKITNLQTDAATADQTSATTGTAYEGPEGTPSGCTAATDMNQDYEKTGFTPNEYLSAYNYTKLHNENYKGQGERVALIEIDGFKIGDINAFAKCFNLYRPAINTWGVGISKALAAGGETTLDLEVLDAAAPRLKAIDVYETKSTPASVLKAMTAPLQNKGRVPQVISASLGLCESELRDAVGRSGVQASDAALELAAAHGVSVMAASGDDGSSDCVNGTTGLPVQKLAVNYPASSKWVTSVGGTQLLLNKSNTITAQGVWNDGNQFASDDEYGGTGGGTSIFTGGLPWYQKGTVSGSHRKVPDIALLADILPGYDIYCTASEDCADSGWQPIGGTSAATPLFAGGVALIDQDLRAHKKKQLGFADPLLYKLGRNKSARGKVFHDVLARSSVAGNDDISLYMTHAKNLGCCTAKTGYDDATGWGGINLANLASYAIK